MRRTCLLVATLGVSMLAVADQPFAIRPGLWNFTTTIDAGNGAHSLSQTDCITAEDVRNTRLLQLAARAGRSCTSQVTRQTASTLEGLVECSTTAGASRIQVSFTASSPTKLAGTMRAAGGGSPDGIEVTIAAEWESAVCPVDEEDDFEGDAD